MTSNCCILLPNDYYIFHTETYTVDVEDKYQYLLMCYVDYIITHEDRHLGNEDGKAIFDSILKYC